MSFNINAAGWVHVWPDWTLTAERTRNWKDLDLWVLQEGLGAVETPEGEYILRPGACLLMRGGEPYTFHYEPGRPFVHYYVHFDWLNPQGKPVPPDKAPAPGRFRMMPEPAVLESLLDRLVETYRVAQNPRRASDYLQACLCEIDRADEMLTRSGAAGDDADAKWIADLCRRIDRQPGSAWSISELAQEFGASRSQFFRTFRRQTGKSAQAYLIDARMRQARFLLRDSGNSISWIAEQLGYRDVYFFSRQFREHQGMSPTAYRRG
ncbi:MAG: helix-turn-helix transcriptional regulator [Phycisphaerae bacterium]|nr:helix-turn-helix transcriptional regulator [Phycisphaerae bacterium]